MHLRLTLRQLQTQDQRQFSGALLLQLNKNPGTLLLGLMSLGKNLLVLTGLKMAGLATCLRTGVTQLGTKLHGTLLVTGLGTTVLR